MKNYTLLSCIESQMIHPTKFYGRFELGKFASGQALTVANTLRRTLLSQLPGVSITLVHIEKVLHEYESISGIQEPTLDIISNLKNIVFTSEFEVFTPQIGFVNIKGPAVVRAGDLKLPFFISCVHPEQYIATLTEQGELNMTVLINAGKSYLSHTPDSPGYNYRVALLKQKQLIAPSFHRQQKRFYYNWRQQRNQGEREKLTNTAGFIQSRLVAKLWSRQQSSNEFNYLKRRRRLKRRPKFSFYQSPLDSIFVPQPNTELISKKKSKLTKPKLKKPTQFDTYEARQAYRQQQLEQRNRLKTKSGYLPINAFFSPVTKVNYTIQTSEHQTGETICFEVWTNGSIDPRRAIHRSVKAIIKLFLPFQPAQRQNLPLSPTTIQQKVRQKKQKVMNTYLNQSLIELNTSTAPEHLKKQNTFRESVSDNPLFQNLKLLPSQPKQPKKRFSTIWRKSRKKNRIEQLLSDKTNIAGFYSTLDLFKSLDQKSEHISSQSQNKTKRNPHDKKQSGNVSFKFQNQTRFTRLMLRSLSPFSLFDMIDKLFYYYNITSGQYTKIGQLNILNLELPLKYYKFLWESKVQTIEDLMLCSDKLLKTSFKDKNQLRQFMEAMHKAFSTLLFQWTGKTKTMAILATKKDLALKQAQIKQENEKQANISPKPKSKVTKKSVLKKPVTKKSKATKKPITEKPATKKPATKKPATKKPATQKSATQKSATKRPATKRPATKRPATKRSATKRSATKKSKEI